MTCTFIGQDKWIDAAYQLMNNISSKAYGRLLLDHVTSVHMFSQKMPSRSCFVVLFAAVVCLCVLRSAEGQAKLCALAGGYDVNTLRR